MNYTSFMQALWELASSILTRAKEKGFDILLLLGVVGALVWYIIRTEHGWDVAKAEMKAEIRAISDDLWECNKERGLLAVEVAKMTVRIELLERTKK